MAEVAPDSGEAAWRAAVGKLLKGAPFESIVAHTADGVAVEPLYRKAEPGSSPPWRGSAKAMGIFQRLDHPDPADFGAVAGVDIEGGATGLTLVLAGAASARGFGARVHAPGDWDALLAALPLDRIPLRVEAAGSGFEAAVALATALHRQGLAPSGVHIDFGLDPLGHFARTAGPAEVQSGSSGTLDGFDPSQLAEAVGALLARGFVGPFVRADGRPYHEAGATEAQELAAVLATGVAYLRALEPFGLDVARAAIDFTVVADADQGLTIAKLRAMRRLWAGVEQACGLTPLPIRLHVETAWRMLSRGDPDTNILRNAIASAAAILGGADSLTVLPHTSALGLPEAFARRLARNTPLVLLEEAGLGRVADPAAGSGAFEALTEALAAEAWRLFQGLERDGGLARAIKTGAWQARIAEARAAREAALVSGTAILVGVNRFTPAGNLAAEAWVPALSEAPAGAALPSVRDAAAFEVTA